MNKQPKTSPQPVKKKTLQEARGKKGFIKRFLDWLAKGAEKPEAGGNHCHT
jgi:hypothetical protein